MPTCTVRTAPYGAVRTVRLSLFVAECRQRACDGGTDCGAAYIHKIIGTPSVPRDQNRASAAGMDPTLCAHMTFRTVEGTLHLRSDQAVAERSRHTCHRHDKRPPASVCSGLKQTATDSH